MKTSRELSPDSFENDLVKQFEHISFDHELRLIAERLRELAKQELKDGGDICLRKQKLVDSIRVVSGARKDQYLVVSSRDYGKDLEFGARNSLEKPWFIPAFVTVAGSIDKCLQGALKRALLKARRLHIRM
ncbi:MAG: hypothetical protein GY927_08865 [bacterium]|nr:hypothetical protein [bacterium]